VLSLKVVFEEPEQLAHRELGQTAAGRRDGLSLMPLAASACHATYPRPLPRDRPSLRKAGAASYDEIGGCQNPKGVIADYRYFDEDTHDRNKK